MERFVEAEAIGTAVVVGVGRRRFPNEGIVEDRLGSSVRIVAACDLVARWSPWPAVVCDGRRLPFCTGAVDLVVSNAVVEHVGGEDDQRALIEEQARVGRQWVVTTPNRWFPVESHTSALFRHWSARWRDARTPTFTRLLSRSELARIVPPGSRVRGSPIAATFLAHGARQGGAGSACPPPG
ncbi:MAG: methyltransferase domain-containing protein [Nocardioidaceae bacterium]